MRNIDKNAVIPEAPATFRTSRRNFLSAAATGSSLVVGSLMFGSSLLTPSKAAAQGKNTGPQPGCSPSGNQPAKCICFLSGTHIATPRGEIAIENLRVGDHVETLSGTADIKWIGEMSFTRRTGAAWTANVAPIKISRGAIDGVLPARDLYVSPAHSLYIKGYLIPAECLVNGISITHEVRHELTAFKYFHIELAKHDALFAEGAPAESYQGTNRADFDNYSEYEAFYGQTCAVMAPFAPILTHSGRRQELRSRLRSVLAPLIDRRQALDIIRDDISARADRINLIAA